jgi:hypothetical protein
MSTPGTERLVIAYGAPTVGLKFGRAIVMLIFGSVFSGIFFYIGFRGWHKLFEEDLTIKIVVAVALLIGALFAFYFLWQILWELFGTTQFIASRDALRVRKEFLFLGFNKDIQRDDITSFQFRKNGTWEHKTYSLKIEGTKEHQLLTREINEDSASWVGRRLATWFEVPFNYASLISQRAD